MKKSKLEKLFELARTETSPVPPPAFAADVLRAVRAEPPPNSSVPFAVFDQLNQWFPRLALACAALVILCVAADFGLTAAGLPELGDGVSQMSSQFLFNAEDL
jgi:hypothetical protein